jgi:hypothetical protein
MGQIMAQRLRTLAHISRRGGAHSEHCHHVRSPRGGTAASAKLTD